MAGQERSASAVGLEADHLADRLTARDRGMARLVRAVQDLSHCRDVESIREVVRLAARELTGADGATFVLRDGDQCHYVDENAIAPLWKGLRFPLAACISGWAMLNRTAAVIPEIYADPRIPADAYRPTFVQSLVMVPIRREEPLGAIGNYWSTRHEATPEEVDLLQALADTTAVAMENVQVYSELILSQKAESTGMMVSGLCHDFSNHISAIQGLADMVGADPLTEEQRRHLESLQGAAGRSRDLVRQLLGFVRKDQQVQRSLQDLNALVAEAAGLLRHALGRGVELVLACEPGSLPVLAAPGQIVQLVLDLGVNAAEAMGGTGAITLRTGSAVLDPGTAEAHGRAPGTCRYLEVEDTGPGVPEAIRGRIFEPFFTTKPKGTGLGLAMVQVIANGHGGIPLCFSEPGQGARFRILLPVPDRA